MFKLLAVPTKSDHVIPDGAVIALSAIRKIWAFGSSGQDLADTSWKLLSLQQNSKSAKAQSRHTVILYTPFHSLLIGFVGIHYKNQQIVHQGHS